MTPQQVAAPGPPVLARADLGDEGWDMGFRPEDIQFLDNYAVLHSRTEFGTTPSRNAGATCFASG